MDRPPLKWLKEESFYRDITTRTLSIAVVALVGYVFALTAGYVASPSGRSIAIFVVLAVALVLAGWVLAVYFHDDRHWGTALLLTAAISLVVVVLWVLIHKYF